MRVRVYKNLTKKCFSIQTKTKKGWRVSEHKTRVFLKDCKFLVYESGRQRVVREKKKWVHAYIEGEECFPHIGLDEGKEVTYNPYKYSTFVSLPDLKPVLFSDFCDLMIDNPTIIW